MSNKLNRSLQDKSKPVIYCLSKDDWDKFAASLLVAEELFKKAEQVTPEDWTSWTSEFSEGEGFPSIIYHDKPVIIRQPVTPIIVDN